MDHVFGLDPCALGPDLSRGVHGLRLILVRKRCELSNTRDEPNVSKDTGRRLSLAPCNTRCTLGERSLTCSSHKSPREMADRVPVPARYVLRCLQTGRLWVLSGS